MGSVPEDVARILGPGETVQLFIQQKIYHPKISVDSVVLTNARIILRHPHDLRLKRDFTDFSYTDVANAVLDKGVLRSTVRCQLRFGGDPLSLNDLPNSEAEKAYGIIRSNIARYQTPFSAGYAGMGPTGAIPAAMQTPVQAAAVGIRCPKCGQTSSQGSKFCGACGSKF
jgi:Bacterial PH domain